MDRQSGKFYAVSFDTPLGKALQKYFAEADRCDKAALDFVAHLSDHYTFPPTADAEAVQSADAEAGGLVAVRVSVATLPKPDPILWDSLPDPDSPDHILYFPRVTISSHYIRYGVAHFLDVNAAPDWTFRRNPDGTIRYYHLEKVRNLIPPDDFQRLARLALVQRLADADDGADAVRDGRPRALVHALVRLAEELAALRVTDDGPGAPNLAQHGRRDFTGEGARLLPMDVLRGELDVRALDGPCHAIERGEGRRHSDVDPADALNLGLERLNERDRLGDGLIHLPVAGNEGGGLRHLNGS